MLPDKDLIKQRFRRCLSTYNQHASVQQKMSHTLAQLINQNSVNARLDTVIDIGCGTGLFLKELLKTFEIDRLYINDLVEDCFEGIKEILNDNSYQSNIAFIPGDAEEFKFPVTFDLISSNATFQWLQNLTEFTNRCHNYLRPDGILGFTTFGPENFREFRLTDNASLDYLPLSNLKDILENKFQILHASEETHILNFPTPLDVLKHLRFTGVTGTRKTLWTREKLERFTSEYNHLFSSEHGVTLTYNPIYIIAGR